MKKAGIKIRSGVRAKNQGDRPSVDPNPNPNQVGRVRVRTGVRAGQFRYPPGDNHNVTRIR